MIHRTPGPTLVKLLRVPTHLYDWHLGWILGHRFLRLTHVGRRSGRHYQTILEVIGENPSVCEVIVIAGLAPTLRSPPVKRARGGRGGRPPGRCQPRRLGAATQPNAR